ncbi:MAG: imidazole glycerol phosphate synthase subunit HisH [Armatimonadetes bacterium]|nr:imidazole glycerol phosphate synthase subunit HisH [Armatimonadota bacterium]
MRESGPARVAIVDYGMGNLFSIKHACAFAGLQAVITAAGEEIVAADAVILPGMGAFGDAMQILRDLDLVEVLRDVAQSGKPLLGVCLGMQLLMAESFEFGRHQGLGIIEGDVVSLQEGMDGARRLKVPQVGWNRVWRTGQAAGEGAASPAWRDTLLDSLSDGEFMYFVHSFYPRPADPGVTLSLTRYGPVEFTSSLARGNVFACQFHPERSGPQGLRIYRNLAARITAAAVGRAPGPTS